MNIFSFLFSITSRSNFSLRLSAVHPRSTRAGLLFFRRLFNIPCNIMQEERSTTEKIRLEQNSFKQNRVDLLLIIFYSMSNSVLYFLLTINRVKHSKQESQIIFLTGRLSTALLHSSFFPNCIDTFAIVTLSVKRHFKDSISAKEVVVVVEVEEVEDPARVVSVWIRKQQDKLE